MIRRCATLLALLWLVAAGDSQATPQTPWATASAGQASHSGGSPCPDSDADGHPCGPACPCACCPGRTAPALPADRAVVVAPSASALGAGPPDALHPEDVLRRIFHPPRA